MLDMKMLSTYFDNDPLYDAYTGQYLYDGQFATYDGSQLDGSFIRRRTVSLDPDFVLPSRRVVRLFEEEWVLSDPITDGFYGEKVRQTMSARKAHGLFNILGTSDLVLQRPATRQAYAFMRWTKSTGDAGTSFMEPYYEVSFSMTEPQIKDSFIELDGRIWHARMETIVAEGFRLIEADELVGEGDENKRVEITQPGEVDPVTFVETDLHTFPGILTNRYQLFRKLDQAQQNNYAGDMTLIVANHSNAKLDTPMTIDGEQWSVLDSVPIGDGLALHVRRI